jgi:hypothetical protein
MVNVSTTEVDMAFKPKAPNQIIHPVEAPQDRALTTSGRTNKSGDGVLFDGDNGVPDCLESSIK